jgi:hypothetical protein
MLHYCLCHSLPLRSAVYAVEPLDVDNTLVQETCKFMRVIDYTVIHLGCCQLSLNKILLSRDILNLDACRLEKAATLMK